MYGTYDPTFQERAIQRYRQIHERRPERDIVYPGASRHEWFGEQAAV